MRKRRRRRRGKEEASSSISSPLLPFSPASICRFLPRGNTALIRYLNPPTQIIESRLHGDSASCRRISIIHRVSRRCCRSASCSRFGSRRGGHRRRPSVGHPRHESHAREDPGAAGKRQAADAARGVADVRMVFCFFSLFLRLLSSPFDFFLTRTIPAPSNLKRNQPQLQLAQRHLVREQAREGRRPAGGQALDRLGAGEADRGDRRRRGSCRKRPVVALRQCRRSSDLDLDLDLLGRGGRHGRHALPLLLARPRPRTGRRGDAI